MHATPTTRIAFLRWKPVVWFEFRSCLWYWSRLRIGMVLGGGSHSRSQVSVENPRVDRIGVFQVPPTGWSKSLGSVPSSWYSAIDNYIASNDGSTSSTSQQHRAGPKARPMFGKTTSGTWLRPARIRPLSEHSCVRPSVSTCDSSRWPVSCGYAYAPTGEVLGHRSNVAKLNVRRCRFTGAQSRWSFGENQRSLHDRGGWWVEGLQNDCCTPSCACQASLAPQLPRLKASIELIRRSHSALWLTRLRMAITISFRNEFSKRKHYCLSKRETFSTIFYSCKSNQKWADSARWKFIAKLTRRSHCALWLTRLRMAITISFRNEFSKTKHLLFR